MADIFISYSSKDRAQAEQLTELLASAGLSVWIDRRGIDFATHWSKEIVDAIDGCTALLVLLSSSSIESVNVAKEVALAGERKKKILPLDIEPVALPNELAYHLAGVQRSPIANTDAVLRAIERLGLATIQPVGVMLSKSAGTQKSLMILPFEDLSPDHDNEWFADGMVTELISALGHVRALRVSDVRTTKEFKRYTGTLFDFAREMNIRYFIEGSVRKFGQQIKITLMLLDIYTREQLWQEHYKGTMDDVFTIQELVAEKVTSALKIHLAADEQEKIADRGTQNAEAYELYLRARSYNNLHTKESLLHGISLLREAMRLDPEFAQAYRSCAQALLHLDRQYGPMPENLEEAELLVHRALELDPSLHSGYETLSYVFLRRGMLPEAEAAAKRCVELAPEDFSGHFALGFFYMETGQHELSVEPFEAVARQAPEFMAGLFNVCHQARRAGRIELSLQWCQVAIPVYERHLRLQPDDDTNRIFLAAMLNWGKRTEQARDIIAPMMAKEHLDANTRYSLACMYDDFGDHEKALATFRHAVSDGFAQVNTMGGWRDNAWVRENPKYAAEVEAIIDIAKQRTHG